MPEHPDRADGIRLNPADAVELAEMLSVLGDWFEGQDAEPLATSFRCFIGTAGYSLAQLQADIDRFAFLLGGDGERLFGPDQP